MTPNEKFAAWVYQHDLTDQDVAILAGMARRYMAEGWVPGEPLEPPPGDHSAHVTRRGLYSLEQAGIIP